MILSGCFIHRQVGRLGLSLSIKKLMIIIIIIIIIIALAFEKACSIGFMFGE